MSALPRVAQLRQQAAINRRRTLEENAMRNEADDRNSMFAKHHKNSRFGPMQQSRFAQLNRQVRRRDDRMITAKEWDETVSAYADSGKRFRFMFYGLIIGFLLLLGLLKYDVEANLEVPQIESGSGFGEVTDHGSDDGAAQHTSHIHRMSDNELDGLYDVLGVKEKLRRRPVPTPKKTETTEAQGGEDTKAQQAAADPDKERRRENYRVRQELKKAYEAHQEGYGQLVSCGRACEAKHQQVELAYTTLSSQVDRELYGVLLNAKDTKSKRSASPTELKASYDKKKAEIEAVEEGDDKLMALEELRDAYEILSNPDAKTYYHMYGMKPPEIVKHVSNRHGGWGQELELGTYKHRLLFAWIDYFDSMWAVDAVLAAIAIFILMRLPAAIKQSQKLVEEMEWEDAVREKENGQASGSGTE